MTRILVTNDDGIAAPGIHALTRALYDAGHDVFVVAPREDMSGAGAAIGRFHADSPVLTERVDLDDLPGVPAYMIDGPPALAVLTARLGGFGDAPTMVVSGINPGANTGRATLHSGTVGAALTAANFGVSGLAVSVDISDPMHWATAASMGVAAVAWLAGAADRTVLNVNVPALHLGQLSGVRWARLAPFGTTRATVIEPAVEGGKLLVELRPTAVELPPDCDTAVVQAGFVSVTALTGIRAAEEPTGVVAALERDLQRRPA